MAPEAYQVAPVLRILAKPRPRLLIADDVGLGKTIGAGLRLLELMYRRRADRVLVVVLPGLIPQWEGRGTLLSMRQARTWPGQVSAHARRRVLAARRSDGRDGRALESSFPGDRREPIEVGPL